MDRLSAARAWEQSPEGASYIQANRQPQQPKQQGYGGGMGSMGGGMDDYAKWLQSGINANAQNPQFQQGLMEELINFQNPMNQRQMQMGYQEQDQEQMYNQMGMWQDIYSLGQETGDSELTDYAMQQIKGSLSGGVMPGGVDSNYGLPSGEGSNPYFESLRGDAKANMQGQMEGGSLDEDEYNWLKYMQGASDDQLRAYESDVTWGDRTDRLKDMSFLERMVPFQSWSGGEDIRRQKAGYGI